MRCLPSFPGGEYDVILTPFNHSRVKHNRRLRDGGGLKIGDKLIMQESTREQVFYQFRNF